MHALAPTFNPSLQAHVMSDMNCDGGSVSGLMPISSTDRCTPEIDLPVMFLGPEGRTGRKTFHDSRKCSVYKRPSAARTWQL